MNYKINEVLSDGYVKGEIVSFKYKEEKDVGLDKEFEFNKLKHAIEKTKLEFEELSNSNQDLKDYINILILIATDPELKKKCESRIKIGLSAKGALYDVMNKTTEEILKSTSSYLRERASDVSDVILRIINNLDDNKKFITHDKFILRTEVLYPSFLIQKRNNIIGVIVDNGGYTSHAAIMCRAFDIPLVISDCELNNDDLVIIDSRKKLININPTIDEINEFDKEYEIRNSYPKCAIEHKGFKFLANVSTNYELDKVINYNFDGIGLYRTELIFMNNDRPYTYEEQLSIYSEAIEKLKNKEIIFRTFDVGDDKKLHYLKANKKGIDNYKNNPEIFETQIKAMLMANRYNNMSIMFPMIESFKEFKYLKKWVLKICKKNKCIKPKIGMMLETKEALLNIKTFKKVDFMSIGTNDLTFELYGIDRNTMKNDLSYVKDLVKKIKPAIDFANKNNIDIAVCGELAGIEESALLFLKAGIKNLSVSPSLIRILNVTLEAYKNEKE